MNTFAKIQEMDKIIESISRVEMSETIENNIDKETDKILNEIFEIMDKDYNVLRMHIGEACMKYKDNEMINPYAIIIAFLTAKRENECRRYDECKKAIENSETTDSVKTKIDEVNEHLDAIGKLLGINFDKKD